MSLGDIRACVRRNRMPIWRALQIRYYLGSLPSPDWFMRPLSKIEKICSGRGVLRHALSESYEMIREARDKDHIPRLMSWAQDLGIEWSEDQEKRMIEMTYGASLNGKVQELGYKLLLRWYCTPVALNKIFPSVTDRCWREGP